MRLFFISNFAFTDNNKATKDPLALSPVVAKSVTTPTEH